MKKIKFLLEYQCLPIWLYNENGELLENGLSQLYKNEFGENICLRIKGLQNKFDKLFEDNESHFQYLGFKNEIERQKFICEAEEIIKLIKSKASKRFIFEIATDLNLL